MNSMGSSLISLTDKRCLGDALNSLALLDVEAAGGVHDCSSFISPNVLLAAIKLIHVDQSLLTAKLCCFSERKCVKKFWSIKSFLLFLMHKFEVMALLIQTFNFSHFLNIIT